MCMTEDLQWMFHKIIINLKSQTKFNTSVYHKDNLVFSRYLGILQQGFADQLVRKICIHHESIILRSQKFYAVSVCHKSNKESFGVLACCILEFLNKVCRCNWGKRCTSLKAAADAFIRSLSSSNIYAVLCVTKTIKNHSVFFSTYLGIIESRVLQIDWWERCES